MATRSGTVGKSEPGPYHWIVCLALTNLEQTMLQSSDALSSRRDATPAHRRRKIRRQLSGGSATPKGLAAHNLRDMRVRGSLRNHHPYYRGGYGAYHNAYDNADRYVVTSHERQHPNLTLSVRPDHESPLSSVGRFLGLTDCSPAGFDPVHSAPDPQPAPFASLGGAPVLAERLRTRRNLNDLPGWRVG